MKCLQHEVVSCGQCFLLSKHFSSLSWAGGRAKETPCLHQTLTEEPAPHLRRQAWQDWSLFPCLPSLPLWSGLYTARERPKTTGDRTRSSSSTFFGSLLSLD